MANEHENPTTPASMIRPGDVLFFAARSQTGDFGDFAQLAAYVQAAPWHHVAIAGDGEDGAPSVIGFDQTGDPDQDGLNWRPRIEAHPWSTTDGYAVTALRPPQKADEIVAAAETALGATYALEGLLAFAAATQGRMFAAGPVRERLLDFAAGAEIEGRRNAGGHTCVTAVVEAVAGAGFRPAPVEPDPPALDRPMPVEELTDAIDGLYDRLRRGSGKLEAAMPGPDDALLTEGEISDAYGYSAVIEVPGPITRTAAYLELMAAVIRSRFADAPTAEQLVSLGEIERRTSDPVTGWRVGPAMLRAALLELGFTEVATSP
jgi:hypothetical protein